MPQNPHVLLTFDKVHNPLHLPRKTTLQRPKVARACCALYILTSKCASRHTFPTSQLPKVVWTRQFFDTFDLEMCFAPQRHVLLRHLNFQKRSERDVFCTFWLRNVLRAPTACTFSTSQLPKVVRTWCVLYTACNFSFLIWPAGSAPAALASLLFDPPEPQITGKTQWIATCLPFRALGSSFFWGFLFFDILSSSLLFSDSSRLCFSSVHFVGRLTSKLPSGSTAQGGGGSFKNRKPIGEVGCCESRMAERRHWWTDRWLRSPLFLSLLFLWLSSYLPTYLPIYLSVYLSISLSLSLSISLSLSTYLST